MAIQIPSKTPSKKKEGEGMTKIIVMKNNPRYQIVDEGSFVIDLKQLSNDEFLSLTENDNYNALIEKHGQAI